MTLPEFAELLQSAVALEGLMVVLEAGVTQQQQDLHAKVRGQFKRLLGVTVQPMPVRFLQRS